jgi:hypothetical protein
MMGFTHNTDRIDKECIQDFGTETSWKMTTWKTKKFGRGYKPENVYKENRL